jgi:Zn finger protein HypA/HybF involved in hydrogenase expression
MLTASCPCGYESKTLYVGCGMAVHAARVPAMCRRCHRFFTVDPSQPRLRCPSCRRKPEVLQAFLADEDPNPDQTFECPACGQVTATFGNCGIWD